MPARSPSRPLRRRRRGQWGAIIAATVMVLLTGVIPIAMYVEAHTVPSGAQTEQAVVTGYDRARVLRPRFGVTGSVVVVALPDGSVDRVVLDYRWVRPDRGDRLEVYRQDGRLRTTSEISTLTLLGGLTAATLWPTITIGWLRSRARAERRSRSRGPAGTPDLDHLDQLEQEFQAKQRRDQGPAGTMPQ